MRHVALLLLLAACGGATPAEAPPAPAEAPAAAAATPTDAPPAEGRRVEVTVEKGSYEPAQITAQPNEKLVLVFQNKESAGSCGATLRFPATGETRELPPGGSVEVPVTAPASGKLDFGCSMEGCHVGAVVVSG